MESIKRWIIEKLQNPHLGDSRPNNGGIGKAFEQAIARGRLIASKKTADSPFANSETRNYTQELERYFTQYKDGRLEAEKALLHIDEANRHFDGILRVMDIQHHAWEMKDPMAETLR